MRDPALEPQFRIVRDNYAGFEVQKKVWWWPWWFQPHCNTRSRIEDAETLAHEFAAEGRVVKFLGPLNPAERGLSNGAHDAPRSVSA